MVSIITVNYNGLIDTCELIESFRKYETYPYEFIVVDNGSELPEGDEIQKRYPEIKVVHNINNGFAGGNNAGLNMSHGDYLFFINNDTFIKKPILEVLVKRLCVPENGGVSPMLKYSHSPDIIQYAGFTPFTPVTLRNAAIGFHEKDQPNYHIPCKTASLHGAAMMVRRDVLQRVGPMAEIYFLFYEEFDWSAAIHRAGYKLWYEPGAVVYHKEGMTASKGSAMREFYLSRARILYVRRNLKGINKYLSLFYHILLAAPKKSISYFINGEVKLSAIVIWGTLKGLFKRNIY